MNARVERFEGKLFSDWQQPINTWMDLPDSIHNDAVATKIGMRGGTIPGTVHLDHFVPLIHVIWGRKWYEHGTISMFYTYATTHQEDVRAVVFGPTGTEHERVDGYVETPEHKFVAKGSLSVGSPPEPNYVASLELEDSDPEQLRILSNLKTGDRCPTSDDVVVQESAGVGEYQNIVLNPSSMYTALNAGFPQGKIKRAVGFFGATEISLVNGPIYAETEYRRKGFVVCVGSSPRTEFAWVDSELEDRETGETVARMRHMTRWMKASSPLWA